VRNIARSALKTILQPLAKYFIRKLKVISMRHVLMERHEELMKAFEDCDHSGDLQKSNQLMVEIEELLEQIDDTEKPLAFRERSKQECGPGAEAETIDAHQWRYFIASTFCDLWAELRDKRGNVIGVFCSFYVCMRLINETERCGTVIISKIWDRLKEDPLATGQRYYCNCCNAKYRHASGSLLQIQVPGSDPAFCRATNPPRDNEDVKAMYLEDELDPTSPADLYNRIPEAIPHAEGTFLRQAELKEMYSSKMSTYGVFKIIDVPAFEQMPLFPWEQMFTMFGSGQ